MAEGDVFGKVVFTRMRRTSLTGAGSGIGLALAHRLADRGDELVLIARNDARAAELEDTFARAQVLVADLADPGTLNGLGRQVDGGVDTLLHVAGRRRPRPGRPAAAGGLGGADRRQPHRSRRADPRAPARTCAAAAAPSSSSTPRPGSRASAEWSAYAASKFGLRAFADSLRAEEVESGVRVSTVYPSRTATPMQEKVHEQEGRTYDSSRWISAETVVDTILHVIDLPADATIPDVTVRPVVPRPGT